MYRGLRQRGLHPLQASGLIAPPLLLLAAIKATCSGSASERGDLDAKGRPIGWPFFVPAERRLPANGCVARRLGEMAAAGVEFCDAPGLVAQVSATDHFHSSKFENRTSFQLPGTIFLAEKLS